MNKKTILDIRQIALSTIIAICINFFAVVEVAAFFTENGTLYIASGAGIIPSLNNCTQGTSYPATANSAKFTLYRYMTPPASWTTCNTTSSGTTINITATWIGSGGIPATSTQCQSDTVVALFMPASCPAAGCSVKVYYHGGGYAQFAQGGWDGLAGVNGDARYMTQAVGLLGHGYAVAIVFTPLVPSPGSSLSSPPINALPIPLQAAVCAFRWLKDESKTGGGVLALNINEAAMEAIGQSAGGLPALMIGALSKNTTGALVAPISPGAFISVSGVAASYDDPNCVGTDGVNVGVQLSTVTDFKVAMVDAMYPVSGNITQDSQGTQFYGMCQPMGMIQFLIGQSFSCSTANSTQRNAMIAYSSAYQATSAAAETFIEVGSLDNSNGSPPASDAALYSLYQSIGIKSGNFVNINGSHGYQHNGVAQQGTLPPIRCSLYTEEQIVLNP